MSEQPKTHAVSTPNKNPPTKLDTFKATLFSDGMKQVLNYYSGNKGEAMKFLTGAAEYVRRVPKLLECSRESVIMAFVQSAQFRFMPSGVSGESYVIPYGGEAKFQLGYQGIATLLYRTGKIKAITAQIIYENDAFEYEEGLNTKLIHKPAMFGKPRGEAIGAYTIADMGDGVKSFKVMDKAGIMGIKELSKAKGSKESPWNSDKDPEKWMWKKTCLIQHAKLLPKSEELIQAIEKDYEGEGMDKGNLDAGGIAVARALHTPDAPAEESQEVPDKETVVEQPK